jgi:tetratricopeptide (TPR) repeat protein
MQTKKIFLASSEELRDDRVAFELMIGQLNQEWVPRGTFFHLIIWENFIDAMTKEGLQQEYNKAIQGCDIFVLLFFTKVGRYTSEEFETAFGTLRDRKGPIIYTYFKDALVLTGDIDESIVSLLEFKKKLGALKHYYTRYRSAEELKWLFSRQLDKLYGDSHGLTLNITPATPQSKIDVIALALVNRFLSEVDARTTVGTARLTEAVQRASELTRHTIFLLAQQTRTNNWATNKSLMEQVIPILQALIDIDPHKHYYFGHLAFALKDRNQPDWRAAKENFDRAINLLGNDSEYDWPFYYFNRAICSIKLDANFDEEKPSDADARKMIVQDLRAAARSLGEELRRILEQPWNIDVRKWLGFNGVSRLD